MASYISHDEFASVNNVSREQDNIKEEVVKKYTKKAHTKVGQTNKGKLLILSKCAVYDSEKSRFIKKEESKGC